MCEFGVGWAQVRVCMNGAVCLTGLEACVWGCLIQLDRQNLLTESARMRTVALGRLREDDESWDYDPRMVRAILMLFLRKASSCSNSVIR